MANEKRLIDAKPLMEDGWHLVKTGKSNEFLCSMSLADVPTVDAVEVVHGHWTTLYKVDAWMGTSTIDCFICSECGVSSKRKGNYCHHCGAKMDGGNEG